MKVFTHADRLHLQSAQGWIELGDLVSANKELEEITPTLRGQPDVLMLRSEIYFKSKRWDAVLQIADTLVQQCPEKHEPWIQRSYALHALRRTAEAFDKLLPAAKLFPQLWFIPYNLTCYAAQLGHIQEAGEWFKKAMALDEHTVERVAIDDPDLIPLWKGMEGSVWKRSD